MSQNTPFSISDKALLGLEPFNGFGLLSERGFTHVHFSYKWSSVEEVSDKEFEDFQQALEDANLKVLDVHGPRPGLNATIASENKEERQFAIDRFRRRLNFTRKLGGDAMVYHVPERNFDKAMLARYIESLKVLEDEARDLGVVIALENHYVLENDRQTLPACFEQFDPEYIGWTFDPGHASISKNFDWLIDNCASRLKILHLNDNEGEKDRHWNPFQKEGVVDWDKLAKTIAQSPYDKPLQLEVAWHEDKHETREEFLDCAMASTQKLQSMVDKYKNE